MYQFFPVRSWSWMELPFALNNYPKIKILIVILFIITVCCLSGVLIDEAASISKYD